MPKQAIYTTEEAKQINKLNAQIRYCNQQILLEKNIDYNRDKLNEYETAKSLIYKPIEYKTSEQERQRQKDKYRRLYSTNVKVEEI